LQLSLDGPVLDRTKFMQVSRIVDPPSLMKGSVDEIVIGIQYGLCTEESNAPLVLLQHVIAVPSAMYP